MINSSTGPSADSETTHMRVIIVEGILDEVLAVLEKTPQSNDSKDNGAGKDEPDKKVVRRSHSYRVTNGRSSRI